MGQSADTTAPAPPAGVGHFERWLFALRWPYWGILLTLAFLSPNLNLDPFFVVALVAITASLNMLLFLLLHMRRLSHWLAPVFWSLDLALLAALVVRAAIWPTPLYPLLWWPAVVLGLAAGGGMGMLAGLVLALAGALPMSAPQWMDLAGMNLAEAIISLIALPALGAAAGWLGQQKAGQRLRELTAEVEVLRQTRDRLDAVYAMASTLGATLDYQQVLQALFDLSAIEFRALGKNPAQMVGMALLFEEGRHEPALHVVAGHHITDADKDVRCPAREGVLQRVVSAGEAEVISDLASDPELSAFPSLRHARSAIVVPLRAGFESYGVVLFASPAPAAYSLDECYFLVAFSNQATIALQNAQLFQSLREERDRIITQQEEIRREIARELHDGPTQTIAAITMRLNYARALVKRSPERAVEELAELEDLARRTTKEIRTMLFTLRPVILETQGLVAALRHYAEKIQETEGLLVELEDAGFSAVLPDETAGIVFSILEEAITNARKHAQAHRVVVRLRSDSQTFLAEVEDDGIGFDVVAVEQTYDQRGSLGLINMKERAELVDGTLSIISSPGNGTRVLLAVPLARGAGQTPPPQKRI
ncbi:MAG: histidine kinase [Anaerolineae bacterium]